MADDIQMIEELLEEVKTLKNKSSKQIENVSKEVGERLDKATEDVRNDNLKWKQELDEKVRVINEEQSKQGITVKQAQEELQEFKAKKGRIGSYTEETESTRMLLKQAFADEYPKYGHQAVGPRANHEFTLKTVGVMTGAAHLTGNVQATYYGGSPAVRGRRRLHFRDLVQVITSATGYWKFYRQNIPVGEGSFAMQTTHGATKAQLDYDLTEVNIVVDYLAGFVVIAKQMLQDLPFMQSYVNNELVEDFLRAEDNKFFGELYSAATATVPSSGANTAEKIIDAVAAVEENDYEVNTILVSGPVWAGILKTSLGGGAGYGVPGGITIAANGDTNLMGIPLVKTPASNLGNTKVLLGDFTKVAIIQTEALNVTMSEHDDQNFRKNLVTIKAEARIALAVLRPDAFAYFTA